MNIFMSLSSFSVWSLGMRDRRKYFASISQIFSLLLERGHKVQQSAENVLRRDTVRILSGSPWDTGEERARNGRKSNE